MIRLKIRDNYFRIIDGYNVSESSREVKFSSLKIDFTNKTIADLPLKYQEVQLLEMDDDYNVVEVIYTGYVNNFMLPKMKNKIEYRELEIDLLSPLAMATVRTADAVGTYELQSLVRELIQPLIDDGFVLKEMNIGNNQITINFLNETVESSLNKLSNKFNFWWYIDKNKNIYINSISYLIAKTPKLVYDEENKINGLIDVIPSIDATDYCNVVNFTNLRLFTESFFERREVFDENLNETYIDYDEYNPLKKIDYINTGDEIEFDIPFDISIENYKNSKNKKIYTEDNIFSIRCYYEDSSWPGGKHFTNATITFENGKLEISENLSIDETYSEINDWVLVRDTFFKNLIVGLKYNGDKNLTVRKITALNGIMWAKLKVINNDEVYKNKETISNTGIVEKQINMNEQWKTYDEILEIANSYIKINDSKVEQVRLNIDKDNDLNIGDTVRINKPFFLIDDVYIITDKNTTFDNNVKIWKYTLKNTNILENYVDLFRAEEKEEYQDKLFALITSDYSKDSIKEVYEVTEL